MKSTVKFLTLGVVVYMMLFVEVHASTLGLKNTKVKGGTFGVGPFVGEMLGVSGKVWVQTRQAFDVGFGYSLRNFVVLYGDYLFHFEDLFNFAPADGTLFYYVGGGLEFDIAGNTAKDNRRLFAENNGDSVGAGLRVPLGVEWQFYDSSLGLFGEFVPGLGLLPEIYPIIHAVVGVRFYP